MWFGFGISVGRPAIATGQMDQLSAAKSCILKGPKASSTAGLLNKQFCGSREGSAKPSHLRP